MFFDRMIWSELASIVSSTVPSNQEAARRIAAGPSQISEARTGSRILAERGHKAEACGGAYLQVKYIIPSEI